MISIIVPVYNSEKTLRECINSILCQSYCDFEVIIIDDGSTDNSPVICREMAEQDERVVVIHVENQGVSHARNVGMKKSKGDYICFVDSDDTIKPDYLEYLYSNIVSSAADIVTCNFIQENRGGEKRIYKLIDVESEIVNPCDKIKDCLDDKIYTFTVWGKLFKRTAIGEITFSKLSFSEDAQFFRRVFLSAGKVKLLTYEGYVYVLNDSSVTNDSSRNFERKIDDIYMLVDFENMCNLYWNESLKNKLQSKICIAASELTKGLILQKEELKNNSIEFLTEIVKYISRINIHRYGIKVWLKLVLLKVVVKYKYNRQLCEKWRVTITK